MPLTSGTRLGPYEIVAPIGAGGLGEVYRAKDTRLDHTVAVKVLASHLSSDPELRQRLDREAKSISVLQHPNICTLYDVGSQDDIGYLVMECLEGQTLADRLSGYRSSCLTTRAAETASCAAEKITTNQFCPASRLEQFPPQAAKHIPDSCPSIPST